jgi:hypothetical protein
MKQWQIRAILHVIIFVIRTGQWKNLLRLLAWTLKTKQSIEEFYMRQSGEYYKRQVINARDDYYKREGIDPSEYTTNIKGFEEWKEKNK